jgi:hypothetical protein
MMRRFRQSLGIFAMACWLTANSNTAHLVWLPDISQAKAAIVVEELKRRDQ